MRPGQEIGELVRHQQSDEEQFAHASELLAF